MARARRKKGTHGREFDPQRWAYLIFVLACFLSVWVLANAIESGWSVAWSWWPTLPRPSENTSTFAAVAISVTGTVLAATRARWREFTAEVVTEISQVTWPTRAETRVATIVVIVMTLICSAILWTMDQVWSNVTNWLYGI
jgi:preprotein translocase subunit SecE